MKDQTICFIGGGNMTRCIVSGLIHSGYSADFITVTDRHSEKRSQLQLDFNIQVSANNQETVSKADVVILAVKPQVMPGLLEEIKPALAEKQPLLLTVAAGLSLPYYKKQLGFDLPTIRVMPNTPAFVQKGVSGLLANEQVNEEQKQFAEQLISATGAAVLLESEVQFEALMMISGCGPAYYFLFTELLAKQGAMLGLDKTLADDLARKTFQGAAHLAEAQPALNISQLKQQVTSPGGVTEQALKSLNDNNLEHLIAQALQAGLKRSEELS